MANTGILRGWYYQKKSTIFKLYDIVESAITQFDTVSKVLTAKVVIGRSIVGIGWMPSAANSIVFSVNI